MKDQAKNEAVALIEELTGKRMMNLQEAERLKRAEEAEKNRLSIEKELAKKRAQALITN